MKVKLIKDHDEYMLINEERLVIATTDTSMLEVTDKMKLSKQNCDEIFGVVDVEKLAKEGSYKAFSQTVWINGFKAGFNKAIELNKDKVFTLEDMYDAVMLGVCFEDSGIQGISTYEELKELAIKRALKPTEIEVEIEIKKVVDETKVIGAVKGVKGSGDKITTYKSVPKLDENGCLILKKI